MKTLFIIRHAKSSWNLATLHDFDRPLNDRGKTDTPMMAQRLLDKNILIDHFVSSPAKRAKCTAELFAEKYHCSSDKIEFIPELYHASLATFFKVIDSLDNQYHSVAVFSHNPGITEFVNALTDSVKIDNMPTCGIFAVNIYTNDWKNFFEAKKELLLFDYPKNV